jgi:hypothetical protein
VHVEIRFISFSPGFNQVLTVSSNAFDRLASGLVRLNVRSSYRQADKSAG